MTGGFSDWGLLFVLYKNSLVPTLRIAIGEVYSDEDYEQYALVHIPLGNSGEGVRVVFQNTVLQSIGAISDLTTYHLKDRFEGLSLRMRTRISPQFGISPEVVGDVAYLDEHIEVSGTTQQIREESRETRCTTAAAACLATLEDGYTLGQRKKIILHQQGTGGDTLSLSSSGNLQDSAGAALSSISFDAAGEAWVAEWTGTVWKTLYSTATLIS